MPNPTARRGGNRKNMTILQRTHAPNRTRILAEEPTMHRWSPTPAPTPLELSAQQSLLQALSYQNELLLSIDAQLKALAQRYPATD